MLVLAISCYILYCFSVYDYINTSINCIELDLQSKKSSVILRKQIDEMNIAADILGESIKHYGIVLNKLKEIK